MLGPALLPYTNAPEGIPPPLLPRRRQRLALLRSFPGGWFVVALHQSLGHALLNLHSGDVVPLPDRLRLFVIAPRNVQVYGEYPMVIHAATLSAAPTTGGACLVTAITCGKSNIAFWRPGMDRWSPPVSMEVDHRPSLCGMIPEDATKDVIYYRGVHHEGFYVLTAREHLSVYEPHSREDGVLATRLVTYNFPVTV